MRTRQVLWTVVGLAVIGAGAIGLTITGSGGFSARDEPTMPERVVARAARHLAVPRGAREAHSPVVFTPDTWKEARAHFADHCASCHGNDGSGDTDIGRNLYPKAPDMRLPATQGLSDGELYWIVENGVRLTGMPAWGSGASDDVDSWKCVQFVRHLRDLTPEHLQEMAALNPRSPSEADEERQDRDFLGGAGADAPTAPSHRHQHQERP